MNFTFVVSFEEALMLGMLSGDYTVVASIEDLFGNELLVMKNK